jgi:glycolate oxidase iron-sulfur subunit
MYKLPKCCTSSTTRWSLHALRHVPGRLPGVCRNRNEGDVARGKIALLENLAHEMIKDPQGVQDKLTHVPALRLLRRQLPQRRQGAGHIPQGPSHSWPATWGCPAEEGSSSGACSPSPACSTRFNAPVVADRHFNALATKPLRKSIGQLDTPAGTSGKRVAFFPGCVVDKMFPQVGEAVIKVLQRKGVGIFLPAGQACCGIPVLTSGDRQTFDNLIEMNLKLFGDLNFDYLVTPCASCTSTIKELWPHFYGGSPELLPKITALGEKTRDITEFLADFCPVSEHPPTGREDDTVTYHDPCHLKNSLGITSQPRALIRATGRTFIEMNEAGKCCGCGGSFNVAHYELSKKIGGAKADHIIASGAKTVATSCPACMMQMTDMLSRRDKGIQVKHVVELYADSLE